MTPIRLPLSILPVLLLGLAAPARAGEAEAAGSEDGAYLQIEPYAAWVEAPEVDGLAASIVDETSPPFPVTRELNGEHDVEDVGAGFHARFGFGVPGGLLPGWKLELGGGYAKISDFERNEKTLNLSDEAVTIQNIDGLVTLGYIAGPGQTVQTKFDGEVKLWEMSLSLVRPFSVSEGLRGRASFGVVGGSLDQDYHVDHRTSGVNVGPGAMYPDLAGSHDLDEELESFFVGGLFGATLTAEPLERLSVWLGAELALLYNSADLDAQQTYVGTLFTSLGNLNLGCSPRCLTKNVERDKQESFGARPRLSLGIDYDLGFAVVGLTGAFSYWSYAPQVVNPKTPVGSPGFNTGRDQTHISGDDLLAAEAGLKVVIPF